jgi:pimeloyl-ACP methyl ester carboxylesterase
MAWADLTDVRCYYELHGRGDPILFIPGLGATCEVWRPAAELAKDFCLIFSDNRGVGQSIPKRAAVNLSCFTSDLVELLDFLQLDRVHVIGMSLGGIVAQRLAIDHPSRVDRLVLISSAHRTTPYLKGVSSLLAVALRKMPWEFFVRTIEVLGTAPQFIDANPKEFERRIGERSDCRGCREAVARQLQCLADDGGETDVSRIAAPTLVLAGEHDALIPSTYARQMAGEIPDARFELIEQTGHNPLSERPREVIERIARFLKSQEPASSGVTEEESGTIHAWRLSEMV